MANLQIVKSDDSQSRAGMYKVRLEELFKKRMLRPNEIACEAGRKAESLYYVLKGSLTVIAADDEGREMIAGYCNEGTYFGCEVVALADRNSPVSYNLTLRAKTACELIQIPAGLVRDLARQCPQMMIDIAEQLASQTRLLQKKILDTAFLGVYDRIFNALKYIATQPDAMSHPLGTQIKITRQNLSSMIGCSREMAGRRLKELEEDGLISVTGKTIVIFGVRPQYGGRCGQAVPVSMPG